MARIIITAANMTQQIQELVYRLGEVSQDAGDTVTEITYTQVGTPGKQEQFSRADHRHSFSGTTEAFPVGSVFLSVVSTNPSTLLGYGTWTQIAQGQMLVGFKTGDSDFGTVEGTGGSKTKNLSHAHSFGAHTHGITPVDASPGGNPVGCPTVTNSAAGTSGSGGSATQDVLNPYFVVYVWKRVS